MNEITRTLLINKLNDDIYYESKDMSKNNDSVLLKTQLMNDLLSRKDKDNYDLAILY